jgi:hypothetical protein
MQGSAYEITKGRGCWEVSRVPLIRGGPQLASLTLSLELDTVLSLFFQEAEWGTWCAVGGPPPDLPLHLLLFFFFSFIHMCIQCLGHSPPFPPPPVVKRGTPAGVLRGGAGQKAMESVLVIALRVAVDLLCCRDVVFQVFAGLRGVPKMDFFSFLHLRWREILG